VIRAAVVLFSHRAYDSVSVDDLVEHVGVHRNSLYKTFGSKRGLYLAALRCSFAEDVAPLADAAGAAASAAEADFPRSRGGDPSRLRLFRVANGNTWTDGTITFYNRSVTVTGTHKSVSNASLTTYRNTGAYTLNSERHQISSGVSSKDDEARGSTEAFTFSVGADVPGGAAVVRIRLDDGNYEDLTCDLHGRPSGGPVPPACAGASGRQVPRIIPPGAGRSFARSPAWGSGGCPRVCRGRAGVRRRCGPWPRGAGRRS
jgi:hypothetical protein